MCEFNLNDNDYGIILIRKISNQNQPTLKHLKERINAITDIRLKKRIILRLISWAFENQEHSSRHWQQLSIRFLTEFGKEASSYYISAEADNKPISIPRNKRMLLYFCVSQLLDDGVFEGYTIKKMVCFLQTNFVLNAKDAHIYNCLHKFKKNKKLNLISNITNMISMTIKETG